MSNRTQYRVHSVRSLHELQMEKKRIQMEVIKCEEGIKRNYGNLIEAFTFRNIVRYIANEIMVTSSVFSGALSAGKIIFGAFKKKKKKKDTGTATTPNVPVEEPITD